MAAYLVLTCEVNASMDDQMSLEEVKTRLLAVRGTINSLFSQIEEFYIQDIHSEDEVLEKALSELHNSGEINLVELVNTADRSSLGYDFFSILHAFENTLPSLEASVEDVLVCLVNLTQQTGKDFAIGGFHRAFQLFCSLDTERPRSSIEVISNHGEDDIYASFISCSLLSFSSENVSEAIDIAENLSAHTNKAVRKQAYFFLGRVSVGEDKADMVFHLLSTKSNSEQDSECRASLLSSVLNFGKQYPSYWHRIRGLLSTFLKSISFEIQYEISRVIAFHEIDIPENIFNLLVIQLADVSPEHKGIVDNIDHLLVKLIKKDSLPLAIDLLDSILNAGVDIDSLDYLSHELRTTHKKTLNHIITKWFLTGNTTLCHGAFDLLHDSIDENFELNADMSLLSREFEQVFVCHKAVGWLFTRPIAAASFILSIFESGPPDSCNELERILYDPLLLSYPGKLKRYFNDRIEIDNQADICKRLLHKLEQHHENIDKVSQLKEMIAPLGNINAYWKDFDRSMQKARDEAPKQFFEQICTVQNILYGNSSIYYINQIDGESVRQEMEMQHFSHSTEMPGLNIVDPQNLDYLLRVYRHEKIKNEVNS